MSSRGSATPLMYHRWRTHCDARQFDREQHCEQLCWPLTFAAHALPHTIDPMMFRRQPAQMWSPQPIFATVVLTAVMFVLYERCEFERWLDSCRPTTKCT
ncbi:hypothetical protein BCR44DRAFT_296912 [Catenaria anguillulae PL171]|uniref:Uncharacterized protein n=1 Tax=Catenaria anguillulae PL171 TaxID=765915 RepID=A0A1Y2HI65_9FUNG|nr:hypothetical protein BCR44DRAFT_296912 [Catenaria anguillulae PL171]